MSNTHQKLEEAIRKACPELATKTYIVHEVHGNGGQTTSGEPIYWGKVRDVYPPIELQHVLRTVSNIIKQAVSERLFWRIYKEISIELLSQWNLTQPLSGQSEETKSWLEEVICG